jgi:ABC-2 type transport system permease protein
MLSGNWKTIALFNPIGYLISGFRWNFYNTSDVGVGVSLAAVLGFLLLCLTIVWWIFRPGYRLKN